MAEFISNYLTASGSEEGRQEFDRVVSSIPVLSADLRTAAIQVKEALYKMGFSYSPGVFRAQDVLRQRRGNCLGLPLLIGSVLGERGFNPSFQVVVNPKDEVHRLEGSFFDRLNQDMSYDSPQLAMQQEPYPVYRFVPLEHLVLDVNGGFLLESTSQDHHLPGCESARPISFSQALSCVYKDRAIEDDLSGNSKRALANARRGLKLWQGNRAIHGLMAMLALSLGKDKDAEQSMREFQGLGGDDSQFYFNNFLFTGDLAYLNMALAIYPPYAGAITTKARIAFRTDPREARFLYALASHLYANSQVLNLRDFCVVNAEQIRELFGKQTLREALKTN